MSIVLILLILLVAPFTFKTTSNVREDNTSAFVKAWPIQVGHVSMILAGDE